MRRKLLVGISCYYHDAAAALLEITDQGVRILAAASEERFSRQKYDERFPHQALEFCLQKGEVNPDEVLGVTYYEKPWLTFERLLETSIATAPFSLISFLAAMPRWLGGKFNTRKMLRQALKKHHLVAGTPISFSYHHLSHASSAYFPSPFSEAAVLCLDGVGEWATNSAWHGRGNQLQPLWEIQFPHSLGLLYSAFTGFCGFKVNSGEYKLMGLAPYGEPRFADLIREKLIDIKEDGSYRLNMDYFDFHHDLQMTGKAFAKLFGVPPRASSETFRSVDFDLAASIQKVTEDVILLQAKSLHKLTGAKNICLAGGVALNCVANGKLDHLGVFDHIWIQPAAGDAGGAIGGALAIAYQAWKSPRTPEAPDAMHGAFLGPEYTDSEIGAALKKYELQADFLGPEMLCQKIAALLDQQQIVGWFQGRMEFGPRALGARSILADARRPEMQQKLNLKIKFREGFRPFAAVIDANSTGKYFSTHLQNPYMLIVTPFADAYLKKLDQPELHGLARLKVPRSEFPAATHVDGTSRWQSVFKETNPLLSRLLQEFEKLSGHPILLNTSFNVRGEPIVNNPEEAIMGLLQTDIDALAIGPYLVQKQSQHPQVLKRWRDDNWRKRFVED